jgi:hypothetical protein
VTERQQLLALAGLIYVTECIRWVRRGAVVLAAAPDRRAWRRSPLLANEHGDAFIGWPLPPFGDFLVVRGRPFSASEDGVVTAMAASLHEAGRPVQAVRMWSWEAVAKAKSTGDRVLVGNETAWRADSPFEAAELAAWLVRMATLPANARRAALERDAADSFDGQVIQARLDDWRASLQPMQGVQAALMAWLFGVVPAAVWGWGWFPTLAWAVPPALGASIWLARRFSRIVRAWHPEGGEERSRLTLMVALSPLTALRASELAGRGRMAWFHPAAVAAAFVARPAAEALAAALWRDVSCPRRPLPTSEPASVAILEAERCRTQSMLEAWARREGWRPEAWVKPPSRTDADHVRYCPRCLVQFTKRAIDCTDCGGLKLVDFETTAAQAMGSHLNY